MWFWSTGGFATLFFKHIIYIVESTCLCILISQFPSHSIFELGLPNQFFLPLLLIVLGSPGGRKRLTMPAWPPPDLTETGHVCHPFFLQIRDTWKRNQAFSFVGAKTKLWFVNIFLNNLGIQTWLQSVEHNQNSCHRASLQRDLRSWLSVRPQLCRSCDTQRLLSSFRFWSFDLVDDAIDLVIDWPTAGCFHDLHFKYPPCAKWSKKTPGWSGSTRGGAWTNHEKTIRMTCFWTKQCISFFGLCER